MKVIKDKRKNHKKTHIKFDYILEYVEWSIKELKHKLGTQILAELHDKERIIEEIKKDMLIDPALQRIMESTSITLTLNGWHKFN